MKAGIVAGKRFCELYWQKMAGKSHYYCLSDSHAITQINRELMGFNDGIIKDMPKAVKQTDMVFKSVEPTTKTQTLWRGISSTRRTDCYVYNLFRKSLNLKKGDVIRLPGYIYADKVSRTAKFYAQIDSESGIVYKIKVPKGSKILKDGYYVFPRDSKFECLSNKEVTEGLQTYQLIELSYINPDKKTSFLKKLLNLIHKA